MATVKKVKKYQNAPKPIKPSKPLSDKDSMNIYANRYDELSASGVKKMGVDKKGSAKDLKAAGEARTNEKRLAKKLYGTTPSNKKGGVVKKSMKTGGSFPDLNKDGKITQKDILIGKGVLPKTAKKGGSMKKSMNMGGMMKKGGKMTKTCKYGCK